MTKNAANANFTEKDSNSLIVAKLAVLALEIFTRMVGVAATTQISLEASKSTHLAG